MRVSPHLEGLGHLGVVEPPQADLSQRPKLRPRPVRGPVQVARAGKVALPVTPPARGVVLVRVGPCTAPRALQGPRGTGHRVVGAELELGEVSLLGGSMDRSLRVGDQVWGPAVSEGVCVRFDAALWKAPCGGVAGRQAPVGLGDDRIELFHVPAAVLPEETRFSSSFLGLFHSALGLFCEGRDHLSVRAHAPDRAQV